MKIIDRYNKENRPLKNGDFLCLTERFDGCNHAYCLEVLKYDSLCGFVEKEHLRYFDDDNGVSLIWTDKNINHIKNYKQLFKKYGYSMLDVNGKSIMEKYGLKQAQIDDRSKSIKYYADKFVKLYEYVIAVLSDNGRADLVTSFIANTPLYVPGGTKSLTYLSQLLAANRPGKLVSPPGSQIPLIQPGSIKPPGSVTSESGQTFNLPGSELVTQAQSSYQVLKDAQGQIIQIRDAAGNILQPGTPAYNNAANEINNPQQAGMGGTVVTVLLVSAILGTLVYLARGDKPKTSA